MFRSMVEGDFIAKILLLAVSVAYARSDFVASQKAAGSNRV